MGEWLNRANCAQNAGFSGETHRFSYWTKCLIFDTMPDSQLASGTNFASYVRRSEAGIHLFDMLRCDRRGGH